MLVKAARIKLAPKFVASRCNSSSARSQVTTLANGVRVVTEPTLTPTTTSTIAVHINTGSRYETDSTSGVAHLLERMAFKGTANRSRAAIDSEVESMGGQLNAYTSRESTVFSARVFDQDVARGVDLLSDMLTRSVFNEADIEAERATILREASEAKAQTEELLFDRLHATAYRGTSLGRTVLGSKNLKSIGQQQLKDFVAKNYTGARIVVAAAGCDVDHGKIVALAEKSFGSLAAASPAGGNEAGFEAAVYTGSNVYVTEDDMPLAHVAYGLQTAGWNDADSVTLGVIQAMLGNWEFTQSSGPLNSSKLVSTLAENGWAKSVSPFNTQYSDTGLFGVYITAGQYNLLNAMTEVAKSLTTFAYHCDDVLLAEAKNKLKLQALASYDNSSSLADEIGRQVVAFNRRISLKETLARIDAVDAAAVKACANRFFYDRDPVISAMGPIHELPDYNYLRRRTYWLMA